MNPKIVMGLRILVGVLMVVFGLNKFFNFMPPPEMDGTAGQLMGIYLNSGFMYLIAVIELLAGLALLLNKFVPLALVLLTAVLFNVVAFHAFNDDMANVGGGAVFLLLTVALVYFHKERFVGILSA